MNAVFNSCVRAWNAARFGVLSLIIQKGLVERASMRRNTLSPALLRTFKILFLCLVPSIKVLGGVGLAALSSKAISQSIENYYQAHVLVSSQSVGERKKAAKSGLDQVLVRISGDLNANTSTLGLTADKAWTYVQQFQYQPLSTDDLKEQGYVNELQLSFDGNVVKGLLRDIGANFWPTSRPTTLVWIVEDSSNDRQLLNSDDEESPVIKGLNAAAQSRGLPLIYPLLDLEDQNKVTSNQVWSLDELAIREASERYNPGVIFVGRFSTTSSGRVRATWQFFHAGESRFHDSQSNSFGEMGQSGLNPLADFLAKRYAIPVDNQEVPGILLTVSNVNSFGDYRRLLDYLESQAILSDIVVESIVNDRLSLRMQSQVQVARLESTLSLNRSLIAETPVEDNSLPVWQRPERGSLQSPLSYRWSD